VVLFGFLRTGRVVVEVRRSESELHSTAKQRYPLTLESNPLRFTGIQMSIAIRRIVTVQSGSRIEIHTPELPPGTQAEVVVLEIPSSASKRSFSALLGQGRGTFATPEEADGFLRRERDQWT
jgi:hypothetical protein